jgi:hypothetical protein
MKLCGFDVGLDQPILPDRRHLRDRIAPDGDGRRRPLKEITKAAGHPVHL